MSMLIDATDVTVDQAVLDAFYPEWLNPAGLLGYWEHCGPRSAEDGRWRLNRVTRQLSPVIGQVLQDEVTGMRTTGSTGGLDTHIPELEQMTLVSVSRVNTVPLVAVSSAIEGSNAAAMLVGNFQTALGGVGLSEEGTNRSTASSASQLRVRARYSYTSVRAGIVRPATAYRVKIARITREELRLSDHFYGTVMTACSTDERERPRMVNSADTIRIGMAAEPGWHAEADHLSTMILAGSIDDGLEAGICALYRRRIPRLSPGTTV
ncbi:hypothetical protein [Falsiroseomonas ponticola]|uniref:hypothetical protein n=1 Tax=Falsiroseomonas ponticola TaxID=2786951 RepID=UPI0019332619|nr:hypothetical protein [Roseomonas ponticola]